MPIYFEGLRETSDPMEFLANHGLNDLISLGSARVLPVIPSIIPPIKKSLQTKRPEIIVKVLEKIQSIIKLSPQCAEAFVPYYK